MTSPFESLPVELQTQILVPERTTYETKPYLWKIRQVSRGFRDIADRAYYEKICSEPIASSEIEDYIHQEPIAFGLFNRNRPGESNEYAIVPVETTYNVFYNLGYDYDTATYAQTIADVRYQRDPGSTEIAFLYSPFTPYRHAERGNFDRNQIIMKYSFDKTEIDLVSAFRILSNRLLCRDLNPNYAREFVKSIFQEHLEKATASGVRRTLEDPESLDLYDLVSLHLYLDGTCRVMDIRVPRSPGFSLEMEVPERPKEPNEDEDETVERDLDYYRSQPWPINNRNQNQIQAIKKQIPIMIAKIDRQLDHLIVP